MHFPHGVDFGRRRSRPSSAGSRDVPASSSPYLQGEHLKRVRTRESTDAEAWLPVLEEHQTLPSAATEARKGPLLGPPLSRVHTRLDSSCLWDDPKKSTQAALRSNAQLADDEPLYEDEFVELFANRLVVRHLLCRNTVAFDLSEIRRARPFCTAARLVQLEAEELLDGKTGRPAGISNGGLGATGIIWARDKLRIRAGRWKEHAVVIDTGGVLGGVGFTVERPEEWWQAFGTVRRPPSASV
ncbi:hypothetical protein JCM8115_005304 [Rhodotorula mucilaginosa]